MKQFLQILHHKFLLSFVLLDIDDFKQVNDSKGHLFGDEVLANFGKLLLSYKREEDILCRYGGEEFIVIISPMKIICKNSS
jgi:diguanylate cyclase (GGDEF)-like protein